LTAASFVLVRLARRPRRSMKLVRFFANLEGRITRKTFWLASIAVLIIDVIVATIAAATAEVFARETAT